MIYKKDANFPYPLLTNTSASYEDSTFTFDVKLSENTDCYIFELEYEIESAFIQELLEQRKAVLYLVIQSKDNKFFELSKDQKVVEIAKNRISLNRRKTILQLLLRANDTITMENNNELSEFYQSYKNEIVVEKHGILGFSNTTIFDGSTSKPLDLFEKKLNPNLTSPIQIELGTETIIINYKSEEYQFRDSSQSAALNNVYVYMGLQKALYRFIVNNSSDHECVYLEDMDEPEDVLDMKLYNFLKAKRIDQVSVSNIDEVITKITDRVIEKYSSAVRRLYA